MRDKYNDPNNFKIKIESTNHCYYCYFFSANTGLWHRFAVTLKENKEKCFSVFREIVIEMKLSESESSIKLVTSNYCKCDLWTTLLLEGKTFPIIEAFFFLGGGGGLNSGPIHSSRHLESTQYIFPYIKYLPQRSRTPLTS